MVTLFELGAHDELVKLGENRDVVSAGKGHLAAPGTRSGPPAVRAVGPFRRVRGQALLPLAPHVMPGAPSAPPDRGSPWEPSMGCLPDEIADERVADGMREWRRSVAELDDKNKE